MSRPELVRKNIEMARATLREQIEPYLRGKAFRRRHSTADVERMHALSEVMMSLLIAEEQI